MVVATGICVLASVTVFPESVGHSFRGKFSGVLNPLSIAVGSVEDLFAESESSPIPGDDLASEDPAVLKRLEDWADKSKIIRAQLLASLAGIPPLRAQQRYLQVDFSVSRLSGDQLRGLFDRLAILQARSSGLAFFFDILVSNAKHSHLDSSIHNVRQFMDSQPSTRPGSVKEGHGHRHLPGFLHRKSSPAGLGHSLRDSHVSLMDHLRRSQQPVAFYESFTYMELEKNFDQ